MVGDHNFRLMPLHKKVYRLLFDWIKTSSLQREGKVHSYNFSLSCASGQPEGKASTGLRYQILLLSGHSCVATYVERTSRAEATQLSSPCDVFSASSGRRASDVPASVLTKTHMAEITWGFSSGSWVFWAWMLRVHNNMSLNPTKAAGDKDKSSNQAFLHSVRLYLCKTSARCPGFMSPSANTDTALISWGNAFWLILTSFRSRSCTPSNIFTFLSFTHKHKTN